MSLGKGRRYPRRADVAPRPAVTGTVHDRATHFMRFGLDVIPKPYYQLHNSGMCRSCLVSLQSDKVSRLGVIHLEDLIGRSGCL